MVSFLVKKLHSDSKVPVRKSEGAVGYDLYAYCKQEITIKKNEVCLVPTGLSFDIPNGYYLEIRPRSGLSTKKIIIPNSPGTIDTDYQGEVFVPMLNLSGSDFVVQHQMRFAQLLIQKSYLFDFEEVKEFKEKTLRDQNGFGSTGLYDKKP